MIFPLSDQHALEEAVGTRKVPSPSNKLDNRISNLRDVTGQVNRQNLHRANKRNALGVMGVSARKKASGVKYEARIGRDTIGLFLTAHEAHTAYLAAKRIRHPGNTL